MLLWIVLNWSDGGGGESERAADDGGLYVVGVLKLYLLTLKLSVAVIRRAERQKTWASKEQPSFICLCCDRMWIMNTAECFYN